MPNTLITPQWVTNETAADFDNNLQIIGQFDRQWDESWRNYPGGAKIGYTVQARIVQRWEVTEGQAFQQQALFNQTVPISINHQFNVGLSWSSAQSTLEVQEVQKLTGTAGRSMANKWNAVAGKEVYKAVYFSLGQPGVPNTTDDPYTDAVALLRNAGVPTDLVAVLDPKSQGNLVKANMALFQPRAIGENYTTGNFSGPALGIDNYYWDPNIPTHTTGSFTASTPVVSGASQTGSTLAVSGLGTYAFKEGDTFQIAGVNLLNPLSYEDMSTLQDFVITADTSGSSTATLPISPSIIITGALRTVSNSPANGAAITFRGATGTVSATMTATRSRQSLVFNPNAFAFVMADLDDNLPGAISRMARSRKARISMRWAEQWNIQTDQKGSRLDTIGGVAPVLPYFAARIWS